MIQNATSPFNNTPLKYLKKPTWKQAHFLHYIAEHIQDQLAVHDFIAADELCQQVDFENWLTSFDISLSFQNC
jgi:hypothetical protein